ncbi:hypothetical protein CGGC5_v011718 [Colletotrichum fructicola Nara gc5]|uniref:Uncharacterized protein n=1 Tax=Colletotrichum fructicola (strain Nara gc5) TaxID=1213859 RepID=A0A7J6ISP8_COLFN|nr:hypothetical protein CGGC5_v011718 [Colletotrichum fructicola Nara gc5]
MCLFVVVEILKSYRHNCPFSCFCLPPLTRVSTTVPAISNNHYHTLFQTDSDGKPVIIYRHGDACPNSGKTPQPRMYKPAKMRGSR